MVLCLYLGCINDTIWFAPCIHDPQKGLPIDKLVQDLGPCLIDSVRS